MKINKKTRIFLYLVLAFVSAVVIKIFELYLYWYYIPIILLICMAAYALLIPIIIDYQEGGKEKALKNGVPIVVSNIVLILLIGKLWSINPYLALVGFVLFGIIFSIVLPNEIKWENYYYHY